MLQMTLRKSFQYTTIVRNINRCFNEDLKIELHFDTYVDIDNHKHAFFSEGPVTGGGENTVAQSTKDFEAREVGATFFRQFSEFGPRVVSLTLETDLRPSYFVALFPNVEEVEMFVRASRHIAKDSRFTNKEWRKLTRSLFKSPCRILSTVAQVCHGGRPWVLLRLHRISSGSHSWRSPRSCG